MLKQITKEVLAKKNEGVRKIRVVLLKNVERNGHVIPQVVQVMECEPAAAILKSGELAKIFKNMINSVEGEYTSYTIENLK